MWTKCRNSCQQRKLLLVAVVLLSLLFFFFFFIPAICLFLFLFYKNSVENNPYAELHIDDAGDCRRHCILYDNKTNNVTLYNNTNNTRARVGHGEKSLEMVIKHVRLEGGFKRGGRIRLAESLSQTVPDRWASVRKRSFIKWFCVYTRGDKGSCVGCGS